MKASPIPVASFTVSFNSDSSVVTIRYASPPPLSSSSFSFSLLLPPTPSFFLLLPPSSSYSSSPPPQHPLFTLPQWGTI